MSYTCTKAKNGRIMYFKNGKQVAKDKIPAATLKKLKCHDPSKKKETEAKPKKAPAKKEPEKKKAPAKKAPTKKKEPAKKKAPPKKEPAKKKAPAKKEPAKKKAPQTKSKKAPKPKVAPKKRPSVEKLGKEVPSAAIIRYISSTWNALPTGVTVFFTDLHKLRDTVSDSIFYKVRVHSLTVRKSCFDLSSRVIIKEYWLDKISSGDSLAMKLNEKVVSMAEGGTDLNNVISSSVDMLKSLDSGEDKLKYQSVDVTRFIDIELTQAITGIGSYDLRTNYVKAFSVMIPPETQLDSTSFSYGHVDLLQTMGHVGRSIQLKLTKDARLLAEINFAEACQNILFLAMGLRGNLDDDGVVIGDKDLTYVGVKALFIASSLINDTLMKH